LLEQLRREAREAKLAAARSREEADARRAKQREMEMLTGAAGGAEGGKASLDAMVARQFAARLAAEAEKAEAAAARAGADAAAREESTPIDAVFGALWREETRFGGDAEPAETRSVQSMVTKLQLPGGGEGGAPPRFVEALGACFCSESTSRAWHAPSKTYRRCTMRKVMMRTPGVLLLLCDELGGSVMEEWEAAHGEPWLPSAFGLSLPSERQRGVANAAADGGVGGESEGSGLPAEEGGDAATAEPAAEGVDAPAVRALEAGGGVGDGEQEYELRGLMSFTRSTFVHAKEGSGHLTLSFRVPKLDTPPARTAAAGFESGAVSAAAAEERAQGGEGGQGGASLAAAPSTAAAATPSVGRDSAVAPEYTPEAAAAAWDGAAEWFVWNDFALGPAAEEEVRRAHSLWKRPAIAVYTRRCDSRPSPALSAWLTPPRLSSASAWHLPPTVPALLFVDVAAPPAARRSLAVDLTALPLRPAERMAVAADIAPEYSLLEVPAPAAGSAISAAGFKPSFKPLGLSELPLATGQLVAIDAEFIAVSEEARFSNPPPHPPIPLVFPTLLLAIPSHPRQARPPQVTRRGKRGANVVVKPARLALARVSCVRGQGPHHGEAFVDSYIAQAEPVVDYLTRFSGLRPGDLDPSVSPHHITTMKAAYLKLRQLVDAGCVFVGHGLKKDFEMINMRVPPEQVLDTSHTPPRDHNFMRCRHLLRAGARHRRALLGAWQAPHLAPLPCLPHVRNSHVQPAPRHARLDRGCADCPADLRQVL